MEKLIRRKDWHSEDHRRWHLAYVPSCPEPEDEKDFCENHEDEDQCEERFIYRNHLPPHAHEFSRQFSIEDVEANDWEVMSSTCKCCECSPKLYKPIKEGDLVDYEPCSGLRLVYEVIEANGSHPRTVYGDLRYIINSDGIIPFTVEKKKNHRGHIEHTVVYPEGIDRWWSNSWVKARTSAMEGFEKISPGLPHTNRGFNHHCKLNRARLRELKKLLKEQ